MCLINLIYPVVTSRSCNDLNTDIHGHVRQSCCYNHKMPSQHLDPTNDVLTMLILNNHSYNISVAKMTV